MSCCLLIRSVDTGTAHCWWLDEGMRHELPAETRAAAMACCVPAAASLSAALSTLALCLPRMAALRRSLSSEPRLTWPRLEAL